MDTPKKLFENISALADGELPEGELELTLAALQSPAGRAAWRHYHLIGAALRAGRDGELLSPQASASLAERLAALPALVPAAQPASGQAPEAAADGTLGSFISLP
ncbi:sigma-E factor negative regulatory protein [Oxalobacteraceae bacterium]|nr:sigma-E factor negative regulatory protein [Oxalobacteraceae bacterium]